jgi:hypothetical protein
VSQESSPPCSKRCVRTNVAVLHHAHSPLTYQRLRGLSISTAHEGRRRAIRAAGGRAAQALPQPLLRARGVLLTHVPVRYVSPLRGGGDALLTPQASHTRYPPCGHTSLVADSVSDAYAAAVLLGIGYAPVAYEVAEYYSITERQVELLVNWPSILYMCDTPLSPCFVPRRCTLSSTH